MAWRIHEHVIRGELDNRTPGRVTGALWLAGRETPVQLDLEGNPLRDIAGCRLAFVNRLAATKAPGDLRDIQSGSVGDMTASRRVRVPEVPDAEAMRLHRRQEPVPTHLANGLYLEWFSDGDGRVVLESVDFSLRLSEPRWRMTREQAAQQARQNGEALNRFIARLSAAVSPFTEDVEDETPMDEFQWEKFLKESDARTERYGQLLEKYDGHPQQEQLVAREMGWDWLDDQLDAVERGVEPPPEDLPAEDELPPLEPDPASEGVDWVRDERGHIQHPLVLRMQTLASAFHHRCEPLAAPGIDGDHDVETLTGEVFTTAAKLAGALNNLGYRGEDADPGFIVASLKRALKPLTLALNAAARLAPKPLLPAPELEQLRADLLAIRQEILTLMQRYRGRLRRRDS